MSRTGRTATRGRRLHFLPLAPLAVTLLGVATAIIVAWIGMSELASHDGSAASLRARVLGEALAARLAASDPSTRQAVLAHARERSGAEFVLFRGDGEVVAEAATGPLGPSEIARLASKGSGETAAARGPTRYFVASLPAPASELSLIAFVAPPSSSASRSLIGSVAALTWILVGAAAMVAFAIARDVRSDVDFVRSRITAMADEAADPAGKLVPVRSIDQVGLLTAAFNGLVERFSAAELAYRQDLAGAEAYDKDRSAFLAALSHELRTPLNAILGFTEVLLSEVDGPLGADARENLEVVRSSGEHLRALIDDILELSALESGELELSWHGVDVFGVAEEVVKEAEVAAQAKLLEVRLRGERAEAFGDARRIRQILGNVVGNAVKFTAQGSVELSVTHDGDDWVLVKVSDTGPGIAPEDQAAIFEEYRQVGDAATRRAGSGLGLAITRRLVQMHGGAIELESHVGEGSCFSIWLPTHAPGSAEAGEP